MSLLRPSNQKSLEKPNTAAANELAIKGILCILIGLGVVLSPYFITSPGVQSMVAKSAAVGWFALFLGFGLCVCWAVCAQTMAERQ